VLRAAYSSDRNPRMIYIVPTPAKRGSIFHLGTVYCLSHGCPGDMLETCGRVLGRRELVQCWWILCIKILARTVAGKKWGSYIIKGTKLVKAALRCFILNKRMVNGTFGLRCKCSGVMLLGPPFICLRHPLHVEHFPSLFSPLLCPSSIPNQHLCTANRKPNT
jgi:hypothetical protein